MAYRLIARDTLIGKEKREIIAMLGPPLHDQGGRLVYSLGASFFAEEWLVITLDLNNHVLRTFTEVDEK